MATISARQARFVNLDGKVQVKKVNSVTWENADYQLTLDKGRSDADRTGRRGAHRVRRRNAVHGQGRHAGDGGRKSRGARSGFPVGVHISSGQVDLATGTWEVPGSKAEVSFENAVASLQANSRAAVRSDPETKQQEITVASGSAELNRGNEHWTSANSRRVTFPTGGGQMTKSQVLAPPELVQPLNLQPITVTIRKRDPVHFAWNPVATAKTYEFQVSTTAMFNHVVMDKKVSE